MKIEIKKVINPIDLTLETQEEIDQLFALLNFTPIANALQLQNNDWKFVRDTLDQHKSENYNKWLSRLKNYSDSMIFREGVTKGVTK